MFNVPRSVLGALAVLVLVHVGRGFLPSEADLRLLLTLAFIPARYLPGGAALPGGAIADVTSFVTYMLVHGDMVHLLVNSVWMLAFGSAVAQRAGDARFLVFSIACGIAGAAVHLALHFGEPVPVVGASAAISGQMAGAIRFLFSGGGGRVPLGGDPRAVPLASVRRTLSDSRILLFVAIWAGLNALLGLGVVQFHGVSGGIAWEAHIGGFLFGLLAFGWFDPGMRPPPGAPPAAMRH